MSKRVVIRGGHVLSMDPQIGDLYGGDVLLEDELIAAVAPSIDAGDAEVIDASGCIVIPGFIDSHRHTWETVIRGIAPDVSLGGYFDIVLDQLAPAYRAQDVYAGNYLGALEAIDAGVTTLLDWSHINNTPDHADEAIRGLHDARLRAVYCYGNPNTSLADWWYTSTLKAPEDIRRVRDRYFSSDDGLMTLAMGTRGPGFCTPEVVRHDWELARDVGAPISVHVGMGPYAGRFSMVSQLSELGLLGPDTTYIHCNYLSDDEFALIADSGGKVSISPAVEMTMGHGTPPTAKALRHGLRPESQHRRGHHSPRGHVHADALPLRLRSAALARGRLRGREPGGAEAPDVSRGTGVRDDRGRTGVRPRRADRLAHARQAG